MAENGRLVIPKKVRQAMGLGPGSHTLTLEVQDGRVVIVTPLEKLARFRKRLGPYLDKLSVDDFLAEKREEAIREAEETDATAKDLKT